MGGYLDDGNDGSVGWVAAREPAEVCPHWWRGYAEAGPTGLCSLKFAGEDKASTCWAWDVVPMGPDGDEWAHAGDFALHCNRRWAAALPRVPAETLRVVLAQAEEGTSYEIGPEAMETERLWLGRDGILSLLRAAAACVAASLALLLVLLVSSVVLPLRGAMRAWRRLGQAVGERRRSVNAEKVPETEARAVHKDAAS